MQRAVLAILAAFLIALGIPPAPAQAASTAKVVVVVGPVGSHNAHYKDDADDIVAEAKRYTSNVVKVYTPNATWSKVKAAAQGASVFVYLGHGNGWPSKYAPFQTQTKNGLGPRSLHRRRRLEDRLLRRGLHPRASIRFAPNAVVLLYHLCYASGNTEPGPVPRARTRRARERVDNYGAGFIGAGARAVFAEGHPSHPNVNYIRQLFTTNRSMETVFRSAPTWKGNLRGPFASQRTPGLGFLMDPDRSHPVGLLPLGRSATCRSPRRRSRARGRRTPARTPPSSSCPAQPRSRAPPGAMLFGSAEAAADPGRDAARRCSPAATRLRLSERGHAAPPTGPGSSRRRSSAHPRPGSSGRPVSRRATAPQRSSGRSTRARPGCRPTTTT